MVMARSAVSRSTTWSGPLTGPPAVSRFTAEQISCSGQAGTIGMREWNEIDMPARAASASGTMRRARCGPMPISA